MDTILITGSTDGIGKLTAIRLAKDGYQVVLHGRNKEKVEKVISEIKELSDNKNISGFVSDLADFSSIKRMVAQINDAHPKIDVLINNAGVYNSNAQQNENGLDMRFAVNYFAPFLLTNGLLPLLENSKSPRVINLSSAAQASVSIDARKGNESLTEQQAYAQSKLALTMWSFAFAKKHPEIITIAVNPGSLLNTKMVKEAFGHHYSSADKGADILYRLATSEKITDSSGKYFDNDQGDFNTAHKDAYDEDKINSLIAETEHILNN